MPQMSILSNLVTLLMRPTLLISYFALLILLFGINYILSQSIDCNEAFSCANQRLEYRYFDCNGFISCYNTTMDEYSMGDVYCQGSYSCYSANVLAAYGNEFHCAGLYSCGLLADRNAWSEPTYCYGELSCNGTTIIDHDFNDGIQCYGGRSCLNSHIFTPWDGVVDMYVLGHMGAANAVVHECDEEAVWRNLYFRGAFSGRGVIVMKCNALGSSITCYGNACNDLILEGSVNDTADIDCSYAEKSNICPNGYSLDIMNELGYNSNYSLILSPYLPDILESTMTNYYNSFNICNNSHTIGDYQQYKDTSISSQSYDIFV